MPRAASPSGASTRNRSVVSDAVGGLGARDPAALGADRVGGQAEADRGHAREGLRRSAIRDQMGLADGRGPRTTGTSALEDVQKLDGLGIRSERRRGRQRRGPLGGAAKRQQKRQREDGGREERTERPGGGRSLRPSVVAETADAAQHGSAGRERQNCTPNPNWNRRGCVIRQSGVPKFWFGGSPAGAMNPSKQP